MRWVIAYLTSFILTTEKRMRGLLRAGGMGRRIGVMSWFRCAARNEAVAANKRRLQTRLPENRSSHVVESCRYFDSTVFRTSRQPIFEVPYKYHCQH